MGAQMTAHEMGLYTAQHLPFLDSLFTSTDIEAADWFHPSLLLTSEVTPHSPLYK